MKSKEAANSHPSESDSVPAAIELDGALQPAFATEAQTADYLGLT
jgi:hypothetical protein